MNKELNSNFRCSSCGCCCPLFSTANLRFPAISVGNGNKNSSGKNQNFRVNWENGEIKRKLDWTTTKNTKTWCIPLKVWPDQHRQQWRVARLRDWEKCYEIWADSETLASEPGDIYGGRGKGHGSVLLTVKERWRGRWRLEGIASLLQRMDGELLQMKAFDCNG